ncbi:MAG: DUF3782 domain-containing protein, partial [Candidatus Freyarchaeota archaeon]|nr:DUF3782 domain-containing protein [Candidatus Jordarchaeia archaeon]
HSKEIAELRRETNELRRELVTLREDFNKRFEEHSKEIAELRRETNELRRELVTLREDFNKRFEEHSKEIVALWGEVKNLRADMQKGFSRMEGLISVLGGRWGIRAEAAFRSAMMDLVEEAKGAKVTRLKLFDDKGIVYGEPSEVEIDLLIRDDVHMLVEVKARVQKSDVAELLRVGELYEEKKGVKPRLIIATPTIDEKAYDFAVSKNIKVYTYLAET